MKAVRLSDFGPEFVRCLRWLRRNHYVQARVKLVPRAVLHDDYSPAFRKGDLIYGDCVLSQPRVIRLCEVFQRESAAVETLIHEWAHAKTGNHTHDQQFWDDYWALYKSWKCVAARYAKAALV